jgi:GNAT superfamily N-acetyltransferase
MTDKARLDWASPNLTSTPGRVSSFTYFHGCSATASAEFSLLPPSDYGVPDDVPQDRVFRFSRVKAQPKGQGGGSLVLAATLAETDRRGLWTVLEASPYPGQDLDTLIAFYEKHGFQSHPQHRELMFRPPGGKTKL